MRMFCQKCNEFTSHFKEVKNSEIWVCSSCSNEVETPPELIVESTTPLQGSPDEMPQV
ncbi:hypothetical protein LAh9_88 [Aeromonas phage LAh_9]|uniref:Uncharacterized protein n=4 Tax=Lahexavirus TaxID=2843411 RepID=A0A514A176_9CAUD|nr:hypothetical protein HWC29_gp015 [Aeromonas phage 4_4572]YP_009847254.1 hypothetical protein HWC30_gp080 [Aeromonas phage LAh_6]YP_009847461.1 hypothetical protein HWC31_gp123 [Aeromonas phage LAh_8]YP_009847570.1 hypothetical protein HWC32_gp089 [Aeromonas phage LAh_9]QDH46615.1 hypothetical protein LAh6_80 [Aeromonas phage LAh_6]QDH46845.1 hypothetical protein LAh8_122 [Aeromonas phage LAh_8]QDH46985.1 hypothetical protein LAh9_88 [Aeromonas phage LAh_9]QEG09013.1 hypothetical protein [